MTTASDTMTEVTTADVHNAVETKLLLKKTALSYSLFDIDKRIKVKVNKIAISSHRIRAELLYINL